MRTVAIPGQDVPGVPNQVGQSAGGRTGIIVHLYTPIYINGNKVEPRLGTFMEVYSGSITLTYSQIEPTYTQGNPHPSRAQQ
jgi:hypothetical protein